MCNNSWNKNIWKRCNTTTLTLSNGAGLKITVEEYYTPNKTKINKVGITPDYEILLETSITREPTDANDTQLNKAKEILKAKIEN